MTATLLTSDLVFSVAEEVFAALVDGEEGKLSPWIGDPVPFSEPVVAWVDLTGEWSGRAVLLTERSTADDLARALLCLDPSEVLGDEDLVDAFGEIANVVGGNIKSIVATNGDLGLPHVTLTIPDPSGTVVEELLLSWRGRLMIVRVLHLP
ncbi:chemotaxis protein CheX [Cellulomonas sp. P24]|jgi:CheY-specific phosphatase CheX|uniref:chemotaxis protein CheX n=1 Tax=Cellulomonas sp. P24 TaxID=2885206 RepID=UPI00216AD447|nr:chemotaxis protein CheX [Cellulomonas sp. P24]MCR6493480.1 chemotaxis protein CheX [Cellulomonas sp. P24]